MGGHSKTLHGRPARAATATPADANCSPTKKGAEANSTEFLSVRGALPYCAVLQVTVEAGKV